LKDPGHENKEIDMKKNTMIFTSPKLVARTLHSIHSDILPDACSFEHIFRSQFPLMQIQVQTVIFTS